MLNFKNILALILLFIMSCDEDLILNNPCDLNPEICWNGLEVCDLDDCPLIPGCTDPVACNYNNDAQEDDDSCEYPNLTDGNCSVIKEGNDSSGTYCNCLTQCIVEVDCTGECGGSTVVDECGDCDGPHFNFNGLIFDNGNCDCDGNVLDCNGDCGGSIIADDCGECDGDNSACDECLDGGFDCGTMIANNNFNDCFIGTGCETNDDGSGNFNICDNLVVDDCGECGGDNYDCTNQESGCECAGCTDPVATNYDLEVTVDDGSCEYLTCPCLEVIVPAAGQILKTNYIINIQWETTDLDPLYDSVRILLYAGNPDNPILYGEVVGSTENDGNYQWDIGTYTQLNDLYGYFAPANDYMLKFQTHNEYHDGVSHNLIEFPLSAQFSILCNNNDTCE